MVRVSGVEAGQRAVLARTGEANRGQHHDVRGSPGHGVDPDLASPADRALARAALFDEAFALHFLEDAFASGHVAGTWGDVSQRKGTHDHYNQNGLEVFTWKGRDQSIVLMGDAHMRPQDAQLAAEVVRASLEQVLDAAAGRSRGRAFPHAPAGADLADGLDVCRNRTFPPRPEIEMLAVQFGPFAREVLISTPVPGLGSGLGALPRFRSEVGKFAGLAGSIDVRNIGGGFDPSAETSTDHSV